MLCKKEVFVMNILLLAFLVLGSNGDNGTPVIKFVEKPGERYYVYNATVVELKWNFKVIGSSAAPFLVEWSTNISGNSTTIAGLEPEKPLSKFFPLTRFDGRLTIKEPSTLVISNFTKKDLTSYSIKVEHTDVSPSPVDTTTLIAAEPPYEIYTNVSDAVTVKEETMLSVLCTAKGLPTPTVTWKYKGNTILDSRNESGSALLSVEDISRDRRGCYLCEARNFVGRNVTTVVVDVTYAPTISKFMLSEQKSYIGQNISLRCTSDGNPKPTYQWKTPNLRGNYRRSFVNDSSILHVIFNSSADFGNYTCLVNNSVGETNRSINFIQIFPPGVIVFLENCTGSHDAELKWNASKYNGGSPIIDYYVTLTGGNKNKSGTTSKTRHSFENLIKNTTYMFCVQARNIVGFGNKTCIGIKTLYVATFPTSKFPSSTASGTPTERNKTTKATTPISEFASSTARGAPTERNKSKDDGNLTTIVIISVLLVLLVAVAVVFFILWMKRRAARGAPPAEPENHMAGPVNGDLYAMVDNSNKSKKKAKNKSDLVYAELSDIAPAAQEEKPPSYQPTDYADISHVLTPNADIVYSNVQPPCAQEGAYANVHDLNE